MTDEICAAETLVGTLAPSGCHVPIPEPLAVDESRWFVLAVEKGVIEFSRCGRSCARGEDAGSAVDHFETGTDDPHHLFSRIDARTATLQRDFIPAIAAYTRAVLDLGYDPEHSVLLPRQPVPRRRVRRASAGEVRASCEFRDAAGALQLQIEAKGDRQLTRRVAAALDACDTSAGLRPDVAREVRDAIEAAPRFLWLVGPNTIEPATHVFRLLTRGDQTRFARVDAVPAPV